MRKKIQNIGETRKEEKKWFKLSQFVKKFMIELEF